MKLATLAFLLLPSLAFSSPTDWPAATREAKPWIQWPAWNSLADAQISEALGLVKNAGFGGILLQQQLSTPKSSIYLSADWLAQVSKISQSATEQDLGVDLTEFSFYEWQLASALTPFHQEVEGGAPVQIKFPTGKIEVLRAYSAEGKMVNLASQVKKGKLTWKAPAGKWKILGLFSNTKTGKDVLDPFSVVSTQNAIKRIDQAFAKNTTSRQIRARFHPAIETMTPVWSSGLLATFSSKRGYDLREQLPAFFGIGDADAIVRVRADYRSTLEELYRGHLLAWQEASAKKKQITRLQTQDATGNIIDQAALTDIPEILVGQSITASQFPQFLLAPSGAHLSGKNLVAASIQAEDLQLKQTVDLLFLAGVNHLILDKAPAGFFPGYITRSQSYLQAGKSSAELLVYYPEADLWHQPGNENAAQNFSRSSFYQTIVSLNRAGIAFDLISDRLLATATSKDGQIVINERSYKGLIIPQVRVLPETTGARLLDLTKAGAKLGLISEFPSEVPGFFNTKKRAAALVKNLSQIPAENRITESDAISLARYLGVSHEPLTEPGLRVIRRDLSDGNVYFIVNTTANPVDAWLPLAVPFASAVLLDPLSADRSGIAATRNILGNQNVHVVLAPGESRFLRTYTAALSEGKNWQD